MLPSLRQPQDAYGLEKLSSEELAKHYGQDFGMETRIGRFHNIYGPYGTWKGACSFLPFRAAEAPPFRVMMIL